MSRKGKNQNEFDPKDLEQTHGSLDSKKEIRTVEQIAGYTTKYHTANYSEYQDYIRMLPTADLYDHAYAMNVTPIDDRSVLESRLEKKFLQENTPNIFRVVNNQMTPEAIQRQKKIMDGTY